MFSDFDSDGYFHTTYFCIAFQRCVVLSFIVGFVVSAVGRLRVMSGEEQQPSEKSAEELAPVPPGMTRAGLIRQDSTRVAHHDHSKCGNDEMYCVLRRCLGELQSDVDKVMTALQPFSQITTGQLKEKAEAQLMQAENEVINVHGSVKADILPLLLNVYMWIAVCKLGNSLGVQVGSGSFVYVLDLLLSPAIAMLLCLVGLPILVGYVYVDQLGITCDQQQPMPVFLLAIVQGVLSGYSIFRHRVLLFATPAAFLYPLVLGLTCVFVGPRLTQNRTTFVAGMLAVPIILTLLFGLVMGSLSSSFLAWVAIRAATLFINLQLKIGTLTNEGYVKPQVLIFSMACSQIVQIFIAYSLGFPANTPLPIDND